MGVVKLSTAGILDYQKYSSALAGNTPYSPPVLAYDLLETEILTGSQASVTFSSLNSTYGADYQHLQVRMVVRVSSGGTNSRLKFTVNGGGTFSYHGLQGNGSSVGSESGTSQSYGYASRAAASGATANSFGAAVMDILDPFETTKYTTFRSLAGNPSIEVNLWSNAFLSTNAVDSLAFSDLNAGDLVSGTRISLYGLKAA